MEDFRKISEMLYESFTAYKVLKLLSCIAGSFYHILDNINWASNIGIIDDYLTEEIHWKTSWNIFNLLRKCLRLVGDVIKVINYAILLLSISNNLKTFDNTNKNTNANSKANTNVNASDGENYDSLIAELLEKRSKLIFKILCVVNNLLRIFMILYSLKMEPYYSSIHPIYIGLCSFLYSIVSMLKQLIKTRNDENGKSEKETKRVKSEEQLYEEFMANNKHIFDDQYFQHYYIDFNK